MVTKEVTLHFFFQTIKPLTKINYSPSEAVMLPLCNWDVEKIVIDVLVVVY